jgi:8-oxo-dGTP diphosphatase
MDTPRAHVAVGLIVAEDGRLLLQHRDAREGLPAAGKWGFFGGHVLPGEEPAAAFLREMQEELGWRPRHFEPVLVRDVDGDGWHVTSHVFGAHLDVTPDALALGEGQDARLFAPDALPDDMAAGNAEVIAQFVASRAYRRLRGRYDVLTSTGLLVDAAGRFVLQHRDNKPGIANPGRWGSFGGQVEPYETPHDGFLREMAEELEWRPTAVELFAALPYQRDGRDQLIYVFAAPVDVPLERLTLHEGQGMAAFPPDELPEETVPDLGVLIGHFVTTDTYERVRARAQDAAPV